MQTLKKHLLHTVAVLLLSGTNVGNSYEVVQFVNPCYKQHPNVEASIDQYTVAELDITNGSVLNFATNGVIGDTIRVFSKLNDVSNPLGINHSGVVVNEDPRNILKIIQRLRQDRPDQLSEKEAEAMTDELIKYHKDIVSLVFPDNEETLTYHIDNSTLVPFALESDGSASEVVKGILPHVHMHTLANRLQEYEGNVYIRTLLQSASLSFTRNFMNLYLGRSYETLSTFKELLCSVINQNKKEAEENVFCSELVAIFYKQLGIISSEIMPNNIIPEELSSSAEEHDILQEVATKDIPLKIKYILRDPDDCCKISCCFGSKKRNNYV